MALLGNMGERGFLQEPMTEAKRRYCDEMDIFLYRSAGRLVGISMTNASDWSTYYLRSTAMLPDFRGKNVVGELVARIQGPLREAGVLRIEVDCCPTKVPMLPLLTKQGFCVTSTFASERYGRMARLTNFIQEEPERRFKERFYQIDRPYQPQQSLKGG